MEHKVLSAEQYAVYNELRSMKNNNDFMTMVERYKELEDSVKSFMGDKLSGKKMLSPTGEPLAECVQSAKGTWVFDAESFRKENPAIYDTFKTKWRAPSVSIHFAEW